MYTTALPQARDPALFQIRLILYPRHPKKVVFDIRFLLNTYFWANCKLFGQAVWMHTIKRIHVFRIYGSLGK